MSTFRRRKLSETIAALAHGSRAAGLGAAVLVLGSALHGASALANPVGASVVSGSAGFDSTIPGVLNISNSPGTIINWQGFSIQQNEITRFIQQSASSAVLNRVTGVNPSEILGQLLSNGKVFLINPNGIVFGAGSRVDVAGLVASSLNMDNRDFLRGSLFRFTAGNGAGISNEGLIHAGKDGNIVLIAPDIDNHGTISSDGGRIVLAAGSALTLASFEFPGISFEVQAPTDAVLNVGEVLSRGGVIELLAGNIRHAGLISANSATIDRSGTVRLVALEDIELAAGSMLSANGSEGADGGSIEIRAQGSDNDDERAALFQQGEIAATGRQGGSIRIDADSMIASAGIDASGSDRGGSVDIALDNRLVASADHSVAADGVSAGKIRIEAGESLYTSGDYHARGVHGGSVALLGEEVKLAAAHIDVSGSHGGGDIRIGGGFQGKDATLRNATSTTVNASSALRADAQTSGKGGTVVVWADGETRFSGTISAQGGSDAGDGGRAEVSGKQGLGYNGVVDLSAAAGLAGTLLLDPKNITIQGSSGPQLVELIDPDPGAGNFFGDTASTFANGNIHVLDDLDDAAGVDAGAFYVFDPDSGALLSAITGAAAGDRVGSSSLYDLGSGNYWLLSPGWGGSKGAMTWFNEDAGPSGVVNSNTSLVGMHAGDNIGSAFNLRSLGGDKYFLRHNQWNSNAGAITWYDGSVGASGVVGPGTSLVGSSADDQIGWYDLNLGNGKWAIFSPYWDRGAVANAGAITVFDTQTGVPIGNVSPTNSLTGSRTDDYVGAVLYQGTPWYGTTYGLQNGKLMLVSQGWNGSAGALTWYDTTTGLLANGAAPVGTINASNSLVGSKAGDNIAANYPTYLWTGSGYNYAVSSPLWDNGAAVDAGAITFFGDSGITGAVSAANSLVGTHADDGVDLGLQFVGITTGGAYAYLATAPGWNQERGALTWFSSSAPVVGAIGADKSLLGSTASDSQDRSVSSLYTGNGSYVYAVLLPGWDNLEYEAANAGLMTLFNGGTGEFLSGGALIGTLDSSNSLVGTHRNDRVGLAGISDPAWNGSNDYAYLLHTANWNSRTGAVTRFEATRGIVGEIGSDNSLLGDRGGDGLDSSLSSLGNGRFLLLSPNWDNLAIKNAGAATWINAAANTLADGSPLTGAIVGASNSLIGDQSNILIGSGTVDNLNGTMQILRNPHWSDGNGADMGALTLFNRDTGAGLVGVLNSDNSLVGQTANDLIGDSGISYLGANKVLIISSDWDDGQTTDAGAATVFDVDSGISGSLNGNGSLVGTQSGDRIGSGGITSVGNGWLLASPEWNAGSGALTWFESTDGLATGALVDTNSLVGAFPGDAIGSGEISYLGFYNNSYKYLIQSPDWNSGAGALTWFDSDAPRTGIVDASSSVVGGHPVISTRYRCNC